MTLLITPEISNRASRNGAIARLKQVGGFLPTWSELADPGKAENRKAPELARVDPDAPDVANLWRVHWFNGPDRKTRLETPMHVVLPPELTGVKAPVVVMVGCNFPMIGAHKVLAA
jgi:cysteine synthase A